MSFTGTDLFDESRVGSKPSPVEASITQADCADPACQREHVA